MGLPRFVRPKGPLAEPCPNLYVANCGPAVGLSYDDVSSAFGAFGEVRGVYPADESGVRLIVSFAEARSAQAALETMGGRQCPELGGRSLHIRYSIIQPVCENQMKDSVPVSVVASDLNIPGLFLLQDFISDNEEHELLTAVDSKPWRSLAKRRVQHYGYEFCYDTRNVDTKRRLGELPSFVSHILERISLFQEVVKYESLELDQLTVNEYPSGVGLSPHIDTHSAFEGLIFSLSLAGPCIMEFRSHQGGTDLQKQVTAASTKTEDPDISAHLTRRAIYLPPRSMLLLSGEARYAWQHYIPHHKVDKVQENWITRASRRVSLTFRKVRAGPCQCEYPQFCDSRR